MRQVQTLSFETVQKIQQSVINLLLSDLSMVTHFVELSPDELKLCGWTEELIEQLEKVLEIMKAKVRETGRNPDDN